MKTWKSCCGLLAALLLAAGSFAPVARANPVNKVTNVSPSPTLTNEFWLTATNVITSINGTNVHVLVYMDDPPGGGGAPVGLPCPAVEATVGQMIVCHFRNRLTNNIEGASIHWHGIELDNDSDGTAATQDTIFPGQSYVYRFVAPRAGLFWYHSHMLPGSTVFGGMYGPVIITSNIEASLIASNVLPPASRTFPLIMGDTSFTNGVIGKVVNGTNFSLNTVLQLCENGVLGLDSAGRAFCASGGPPGDVVLVNGTVPRLSGTYCTPSSNSAPVFFIGKNQRVRLQLFNESISRDFYLTLHYPCSNPSGDTNLYHIGGQGGLLDNAILDGGIQSGYDFQYKSGTIDLGTGMRSDVMFYSSGNIGDVIQLVGNPLGGPWHLDGFVTNYPVAFFVITNGGVADAPLSAGSPILSGTGSLNENLRLLNTNTLAAPPMPSFGNQNNVISLENGLASNAATNVYTPGGGPNIDGYAAVALGGNSGFGSWTNVPHPPSAIWARIGDVLQLAIANNTGAAGGSAMHPYHLHGFSMQPVSIYSADMVTNLYNYPFNEFLDTVEILPGQALVFRIKLTDRPIFADSATGGPVTIASDSPTGGGLGRWLMHCHIFLHSEIGMISELNVIPNMVTRLVGPAAGTNSVVYAGNTGVTWTFTANDPWLHPFPGFTSGNANITAPFTYDANPGATRVGSLILGGETITVTQAGATYVQAPAPVTTLATGLSGPTGIQSDGHGNVIFCDGGHGALKSWNPANNLVTTLASGFGNLQGMALDSLGNAYFADFSSTAVRMWSASTHTVSTVFNNDATGVSGVAADGAGNVYISIPSEHMVKQWSPATGTLTSYTTNGLNGPYGVAVDATGALYAADTLDNAVKKLGFTVIFFMGHPIFIPSWNTVVSNVDLSTPWNLAVDDAGNIYIADGGHNAIKRYNYEGANVTTLVSSGLGDPTGVAVDRIGNVFISDFNNGAIKELPYAYVDPTPKNETAEANDDSLPPVLPTNADLLPPFVPTVNQFWLGYLGATNGIIGFVTGANLSSPRSGAITVLGENITVNQQGPTWTLGTSNLLQGPAAGSNTVALAVVPSIALWFATPQASWLHLPFASGTGSGNILFTFDANPGPTRSGTLTISGQVLTVTQAGSTYIQAPTPVTTLVATGLSQPVDLAVDQFGNVIISDGGNNAIKEWSPGTSTASPLITNGLSNPQTVAVDGAGNIYIADFYNMAIKKWRVADSSIITLADVSPNHPTGIALDSATNVYWSNPANNSIMKWLSASSNVITIPTSGLNGPYGLAVDVAGNIYIADTLNNAIKKWNPATAATTSLVTNGINQPWNCAVDGSGNVYVADGFNNDVREWVAANGSLVTLTPPVFSDPTGVAVDAFQNVYIADFGNNAIKELARAFIDPSPRLEPFFAGADALPVVLFPGENLLTPFAPTVNQPWLNVSGVSGGVVSFNFTANPGTASRNATLNLLGQNISVTQGGLVFPPALTNVTMISNGVFQFGFTNGTPGATFTVLSSTNLTVPLTNWTVIGAASNISPGVLQFTDTHATNLTRFYLIRSP